MKHSRITKPTRDTNIMHIYTQIVFKTIFMMSQHSSALKYLPDLSTIVMRIALIMPFNIKIPLFNAKVLNFATGKASEEFKDDHIIISNNAHSVTPYTKAKIQNGYVIPQESKIRFTEN